MKTANNGTWTFVAGDFLSLLMLQRIAVPTVQERLCLGIPRVKLRRNATHCELTFFFFVTEKDEHPSAPFLKIGAYEHKALCESELSLCSIRIHALGIQQRGYFYKQGLSRSSYVVTGYKY